MKIIDGGSKLVEFFSAGRNIADAVVDVAAVEFRFGTVVLIKNWCSTYPTKRSVVSVVKAGHHRAQQFDRQSALQTSQKDKNDRKPFTITFHPHNHAVKSIILNNFKLLQNDPETGRIFSQPPLISFKREKGRQLFS